MTLEPTREEWMAAHQRAVNSSFKGTTSQVTTIVEAALGTCPPEPAPEPWRWGTSITVSVVRQSAYVDGPQSYVALDTPGATHALPPEDAEEFGQALIGFAQWLREHGGQS